MDPAIQTLMDGSLDGWLADVPDWTPSQGEQLMDTIDENEMEIAAKNAERYYQLLKKRSVIKTKSLDELCLARALVSAKAYVDKDRWYLAISTGQPAQEQAAQRLHEESGVPKGICGYREVQKMQEHLFPQGYQIKVFEGTRSALWYCDPKFESAPKKLYLLKIGEHFHGIRSVPPVLNRNYYCDDCGKGYDHANRHICSRLNCGKCQRYNGRCADVNEKKAPFVFCEDCRNSFYGVDCFATHKRKNKCKKIKKLTGVFSFVKFCEFCNLWK